MGYTKCMKKGIIVLLTVFATLGCRSSPESAKGAVDTATTVLPSEPLIETEDSAAPEPPEEMDLGPLGVWQTCGGTLTRTETTFSWLSNLGPCSIEGTSSLIDGVVTLSEYSLDACEDPPWWLDLFPDGTASYRPLLAGTRLTLLPTVPVESGRVLNLEEELDVQRWNLVSNEGDINDFKMCWARDGYFMEGRYSTLNGSTQFISEGGIVTQVLTGSEGETHWTTRCTGGCPCSAIMSIEEQTDETIAGRYHGANCDRIFEGTFTGTATP
jgi:hypothetical protein